MKTQKNNLPDTKRRRIESSNIYDSIEPLYFVTLLMGLSPYLYNFTNKSAYKSSKLAILYSFCLLIIVLVVYDVQIHVKYDTNSLSITTLMDIVHIHYCNVLSIIIIVTACWQHKRFIYFMEKMENIDITFEKLGFKIKHKRTKYFICVYLFVAFGISLFLETTNCAYTWKRTIPLTLPCWYYCYYSMSLSNMMEIQFSMLAYILGERFSTLNSNLFQLKLPSHKLSKGKGKHNMILKSYQKCHAEISDACRLLNSIFTFPILIDIGYTFLQGTLSFVHVFQKVVKELLDLDMLTTSIWGSYYILRLFLITKFCGKTINEAQRSARILHNIDFNVSDDETNWTILLFSKQLLHNKLHFNGNGFFFIDMTLFFTVIVGVSQYILYLVQMDKEDPSNSANVNVNVTVRN